METIRNYIETMFASLPQTEDVLQIKEDMISNVEEKYHTMRASGMTEDETVGKIIASIGSAKDLRAELGIENETSAAPSQPMSAARVTQELIEEYKAYRTKRGTMIAIALAFFILSPCTYLFFNKVFFNELWAQIVFFVFIAIGVGLCIVACRHDDYYEDIFRIDSEEQKDERLKKGKYSSLFASVAFPLATIVYLCIGFFWDFWHPGWVIYPICAILTGIIGIIEDFIRKS